MTELPRLSKDAERLAVKLYKRYLERIKNGQPRKAARMLGDCDQIAETLCPGAPVEDVADLLWELAKGDYIDISVYDDMPCECELTVGCIVAMENRFKDGVKSILEFFAALT